MSIKVRVLKSDSYDINKIEALVEDIFENSKLANSLNSDIRVAVKPNMLMSRSPETATTTHPSLVAAVVKSLKKRGVENIVVIDSPGGPFTVASLKHIYKTCGFEEALVEGLLNLDTGYREVKCDGVSVSSFNIINGIAEADVIINLPKLKTHAMTTLSASVKNLFGCIPGLQKPGMHYKFPEKQAFSRMLVELTNTIKPQLSIVDAIYGMEGDGPSGGEVRKFGYLISSESSYACDEVCADLLGLEGVETINIARSLNLTPEFEVTGDGYTKLNDVKLPKSKSVDFTDHIPSFLKPIAKFLKRRYRTLPVIRESECVGCGKCAESCPAHTISIVNKKAVIDYKSCIACFCCHEMCPFKVIDIKSRKERS